jgi:hypothetical protein
VRLPLLDIAKLSLDSIGRERREHRVFQQLLQMVPGLEERLLEGSDEDVIHIGELVRDILNPTPTW